MSKEKTKQELEDDLEFKLSEADSIQVRIELLLIQIARYLKKIVDNTKDKSK